MVAENKSQKFRLKNIDETGNYFLEEIKKIFIALSMVWLMALIIQSVCC